MVTVEVQNGSTLNKSQLSFNAISLFSGIGGFELAAQLVFGDDVPFRKLRYQTFQFVEINPYAQKVLQSHFPNIPIWSDIRTYHPPKPGRIGFPTIVVGGFPCTDTSGAGKKQGLAGKESGLWWEMYRVIVECQPDFVIIENPTGIIHRGLRTILGALRLAGYETEVEVISASELGAPHERQRVFVIAYKHDVCLRERHNFCCWNDNIRDHIAIAKSFVSYPETQPGSVRLLNGFPQWMDSVTHDHWWKANQPPVSAGIEPRTPGRRECVSLYGRSIVPQCAAIALMRVQFLASLL